MFLEGFKIPLPLIFGLLEILDRLFPVAQVSSQYFLDVFLAGPKHKKVFLYMQCLLALSNSILLAHHAITFRTFIIGGLFILFLAGREDTSPGIFIERNHGALIYVIIKQNILLGHKSFDFICIYFHVIFHLHDGQEFTPLFLGQVTIVLDFFLNCILHECWKLVLSCNMGIILRELLVSDDPICRIMLIPLI